MPKTQLRSGLKIHYQQVGQGPDLVMIHGLTGSMAIWHLKIVPTLWDHFRITTYDLRGHGYSDVPPTGYSADVMATDLKELLEALDIEQPCLVGHSFGADIALYFAHRYPKRVKQVIAIEPALPAMNHHRRQQEWEGWDYWSQMLERAGHPVPPERRSDIGYLVRLSLQVPKRWGPLNGRRRDPRRAQRLLAETTIVREIQLIGELTLDRIAHITIPVHLIYNESSIFVATYDYLLTHLPNVRAVLLPSSQWAHFGPLEQPELVAEHVLEALKPQSTASAASDGRGCGHEEPEARIRPIVEA